jgi:DNA-binding MarR family transcriptional regulator
MVLRADQTCDGPDHPLDHLKAGRRPEIEQLRQALSHMSGAERRLRARDHARPGELTTVQLRSLAALARQPEMTAGQLARSVDLNPATVTGMLDQLEQADIVKRHRSVEDRRVLNVSLTAHGWELLEGKLATWQSMWEEKLADVTDEEIRTGVRVIQQVTELYGEISERLENMEHRETRRG